jgi:hypothetical protein
MSRYMVRLVQKTDKGKIMKNQELSVLEYACKISFDVPPKPTLWQRVFKFNTWYDKNIGYLNDASYQIVKQTCDLINADKEMTSKKAKKK